MKWSLRIGKIFGIEFRIHLTFFLLLFFIFLSTFTDRGLPQAALVTFFVVAIFACVLIHEISHSLIAQLFGKHVRSITLLPIGGIAAMEQIPEKPAQEIAMAAVGPLINLFIAALLYLLAGRRTGIALPNLYLNSFSAFYAALIGANVILALFNLIPAFPMDGGRILRGILALKIDYLRATTIAVHVGQALALLFIFFGLFYNWWLALIGVFLYMGAGSEKQHVLITSLLHSVPAHEAMTTNLRTLHPDEPVANALEHFHHGCQDDFPVVGDAGLEGILTRDRILAGIHKKGLDTTVAQLMDPNFDSVSPYTPLDEVYAKLLSSNKTAVAVVDNDQIVGIVCLDGIARYFMIKNALKNLDSTF